MTAGKSEQPSGVIGPNSVIQLRDVLMREAGRRRTFSIFSAAGQTQYFCLPPKKMVDERKPQALFRALFEQLPADEARRIAVMAGEQTAEYIMQHRIPGAAQTVLRMLPPIASGPSLLRAIEKNAWTFAGSGTCRTFVRSVPTISITDNPLMMPGGAWHYGVFSRLFRRLVCAHADVAYTVSGDGTCTFNVLYGPQSEPHPCSNQRRKPMCVNCTARDWNEHLSLERN